MTKATKNVRHSSKANRWGTSKAYVTVARAALGRITVDPFSEPEFNRNVGADRILTGDKGHDGFRDRWLDHELCPRADWLLAGIGAASSTPAPANDFTALVNAPGDPEGENVKKAWRILVSLYNLGWLGGGAVWVGFTLNQMQTLQHPARDRARRYPSPLCRDYSRVVPARREPFVPHSTVTDAPDQPSHPSFMVLLPALVPAVAAVQLDTWRAVAGELGDVL